MQTVPDKSQRPQEATGICRRCSGTGRVTIMVKGKQQSQMCFSCRGTGQGGRGYPTK